MKKETVKKGIHLNWNIPEGIDKLISILSLMDGSLMLISLPFSAFINNS
tara:strand:- start:839 stop:985 length:147 start_codon:yes stop_codon:yes gene_type:complete